MCLRVPLTWQRTSVTMHLRKTVCERVHTINVSMLIVLHAGYDMLIVKIYSMNDPYLKQPIISTIL